MERFKVFMVLAALAAMFVPGVTTALAQVPGVILDNGDAGYSESGDWRDSSLPGYNSSSTRYSNAQGAFAQWTPEITAAGTYDVFIYKVVYPESDSDAVILIAYDGGQQTVHLDYTSGESGWEYLGTYPFAAGSTGYVRNTRTTGFSRADAIEFKVPPPPGPRLMEKLDRGVVAVSKGGSNVYVGWRMLGTEPETVGYNVYRNGTKLNGAPITSSCNYSDAAGSPTATYSVAAVIDAVEQERSDPVEVWNGHYIGGGRYAGYRDVPLQRPAGGTTPDGVAYDYTPGDISVGDLDGDGQYEIVLIWGPSNSKDNSQPGYTGNVYLDAYEMDGTFLWRIDLGVNIRAGAHYTQFMVYDFDSDGRAEVVCKTADGTTDGDGAVLGNPAADWRNSSGYILSGPEYLSVFDGRTGAFIDTVDYDPPRGNVPDWGDNYGNRVDRFLACVAYLDGRHPSVVMCRGYYTRTVLAAWDLVDGALVPRWVFDSNDPGNGAYAGQGNHNLSVADVDGDGMDEIVYGSCTIDHNGSGLYSTGLGHGDALHVSDMDPARTGLEVWMPHESARAGATYRDAATGAIILEHPNAGDVGRGAAAHIDARYPGYQLWSYATNGVYNTDGTKISDNYSSKMMGHLAWWTGDLQREFLGAADGAGTAPVMDKWGGDGAGRLISLYSVPSQYDTKSINGTKATPCISGDILGDWREEIIYHSADKTKLRIFTSPEVTPHRIRTLMHDAQYRLAMAWQNVAYNQPPHPGFYIGEGMGTPPLPNIVLVDASAAITPGEFILSGHELSGGTNISLIVSNAVLGHAYQVLATDSLLAPDWQPAAEAVLGKGSDLRFEVPVETMSSNRYFKLDVQQR